MKKKENTEKRIDFILEHPNAMYSSDGIRFEYWFWKYIFTLIFVENHGIEIFFIISCLSHINAKSIYTSRTSPITEVKTMNPNVRKLERAEKGGANNK